MHLACRACLAISSSLVFIFPWDSVFAQTEVTATLAGHASLSFNATVEAPQSAGTFFETAGKFNAANRQRKESLGSIDGVTFVGDPKYPRKSGGSLPMKGQSVQGFSGIVSLGKDEFLVLTDNGFCSKLNSQDALLMVHHVKANWSKGELYNMMYDRKLNSEGTTFYRFGWSMLDNIIVSYSMITPKKPIYKATWTSGYILKKDFMLIENKDKYNVPLRTFEGKKYLNGYSDHLPVYLILTK